MRKIYWTPIAKSSLNEVVSFLRKLWGEDVEYSFLKKLESILFDLQSFPEMGSIVVGNKYRRVMVHETVTLFYTHTDDAINVILIWDNRQDPRTLHKKLL